MSIEVGDMVSSPLNGKRWQVISVSPATRTFRIRDIEGTWRDVEWPMIVLESPGWALHKANEQ